MVCLKARREIRKLILANKLKQEDVFDVIRKSNVDFCVHIVQVTEETYHMKCSRVACIILSHLSPKPVLGR